ncbi:MAG TPA: hypothetical protein VGC04_10130, partial [Cellulomonas sp.]
GYDVVVADTANHLLRGVSLADGAVTTLAGTGDQYVVGGPDNEIPWEARQRPGTAADDADEDEDADDAAETGIGTGELLPAARRVRLSSPWDVVWHPGWSAFAVAMAGNHTLWAFDPLDGSMRHVAGTMNEGLVDGPVQDAWFAQPSGLAVDGEHRLWVADSETSALRVVTGGRSDARVDTVVGAGLFDFGHRDGPAADARLQHPLGVAAAPDGSILVADTYNGAVRRWACADDHAPSSGAGVVTTLAEGLVEPSGLVVTAEGVLIVESAAHRITRLAASSVTAVDHGAHRTRRPVTDIAPGDVDLTVPFTPGPGQKSDDRYGPSTQLSVSASPPELLLDGAGDGIPLTRHLRLNPAVAAGVLHVSARAASCDADPAVEFPACHLAQQDWGVPIQLVEGAPATLTLPLLG